MGDKTNKEIIIVRSLTNSDLGLFAAHRPTTSSKQRALNINAELAERLLSTEIFSANGQEFDCTVIFANTTQFSKRHIGKVGKNWRLGGKKIDGEIFSKIDSRDFALIRSVERNDGTSPVTVVFISRYTDRLKHAKIGHLVELTLRDSMAIFMQGSAGFQELAVMFPGTGASSSEGDKPASKPVREKKVIPPMPREEDFIINRPRTIKEKLRSRHIMEHMLKVSSDLSATAQVSFIETVGLLADQLRTVLTASRRILQLKKDHSKIWRSVAGKSIGFVDGGLANLSMLGSAPIAARVGGYIVRPGDTSPSREKFIMLKRLINELYSSATGGVYDGSFPDISALRDAARISIEAAGAVKILKDEPSLSYLFLHGALVNPVSRYTDIMRDGKPRFPFPNFSVEAQQELLQDGILLKGRDANFVNVYLKQLQQLSKASSAVCGVIEREATTSSTIRAVLNNLENHVIAPHLPVPPEEWKDWVTSIIDPTDEDESVGQRITDSLLFKCVLEPGEVLVPVELDRNDMRRAPAAWQDVIRHYPKPFVSYLRPDEWSSPIRLEIFKKDLRNFEALADLLLHCSLLLPTYSFPAGLDIVDKFAKIPNWMSRPINTNTAVQALKQAMDKGDEKLFDALRKMLCGSSREWMLRPGIMK